MSDAVDITPYIRKRQKFEGKACLKCGAITQAKNQVCRACQNGYGLPDPRTLSVERIVTYVSACKAELQRRRDELDAALNEPAAPAAKETQA